MLETSQIISIVLVFAPVIAFIPSLTGVFDVGYKDAKKKFEDVGTTLKERKIENWRRVFSGKTENGVDISLSDDYIANVLRNMKEGEVLQSFLKFCRRSFHLYYALLLLIFCLGVIHGFFDLINWLPDVIEYVNGYKVLVIASVLVYVVVGTVFLFSAKYLLEKKHNEYREIN